MSIIFAAISPHPPIILPTVGSEKDLEKVKKTIKSLDGLRKEFNRSKPDTIIISSPHQDWGFEVPLFFIAKNFGGEIKQILTGMESPRFYFEQGKKVYTRYKIENSEKRVALIASGDLSHCLKEDGPYGFNPDSPKFDEALIDSLKKKDIENILKLNETYPEAGECGLRSFCFLLGILEESKIDYRPKILSYEGPFGVGYLVANFLLK